MTYCATDVAATTALYAAVWPKFAEKCPHSVTFAALLEMGSAFLPVDQSWPLYVSTVEQMYNRSIEGIEEKLRDLVECVSRGGLVEEQWKRDPWLRRLDWTPVPARYTKERRKTDGLFARMGNRGLLGQ